MLIEQEIEEVKKEKVIVAYICDRCKKRIEWEDHMEFQEMHHIDFRAGYGSIFGDETRVKCDLCQDCLKELIGEFARTDDDI